MFIGVYQYGYVSNLDFYQTSQPEETGTPLTTDRVGTLTNPSNINVIPVLTIAAEK